MTSDLCGSRLREVKYFADTAAALCDVQPGLRRPGLWVPRVAWGQPYRSRARQWVLRVLRPFRFPTDIAVARRRLGGVPVVDLSPLEGVRRTGTLVWLHGGGHIFGRVNASFPLCVDAVRQLSCRVVAVDYRVAPFPADFDDAFAVVRAVVDSSRGPVVVGGDSAGGGLAAAVAQRAYDERLELAFQCLVYPMLDNRTGSALSGAAVAGTTVAGAAVAGDAVDHGVVATSELSGVTDSRGAADRVSATSRAFCRDGDATASAAYGRFVWTPALNRLAWRTYLGHGPDRPETRKYAVPADRDRLEGLAPAWIGVGDIDLFCPESTAYAERLAAASVPCELHVESGMYHAADAYQEVTAMKVFRSRMFRAIRLAISLEEDDESHGD